MNYGEMNTENSRNSLRRIARHEESEFSNASILNSMEKFVRSVNEMEETILVPSRLLDLSVGDATDGVCQKASKNGCEGIKNTMMNTDLYRLYNIINQIKVDLLWSQDGTIMSEIAEEQIVGHRMKTSSQSSDSGSSNSMSISSSSSDSVRLGHARCPSTTSMQSVQSALSIVSSSASDTDSDVGIENDSGLETEEPSDRVANLAAENFRRHLRGLHRSIQHMTEAAQYLTLRYQADVGGQV